MLILIAEDVLMTWRVQEHPDKLFQLNSPGYGLPASSKATYLSLF